MPSDPRPYVTVAYEMPLHDKVRDLSHLAFRLLIEAWCWCGRNKRDGDIPKAKWAKMRTAKARAELVEAGLVIVKPNGDAVMRDYLKHQLSRAESEALSADRSRAAVQGNHQRWHVDKGVVHPDCPLCPSLTEPISPDDEEIASAIAPVIARGIANASQTDRNINLTFSGPRESTAATSPSVTHAIGGGSDKWKQLRSALKRERPDVAWTGWRRNDTDEADELAHIHGVERLFQSALSGRAPGNAKAWLTRWRDLERPKPTAVPRECEYDPEHPKHTGSICGACRTEMLTGEREWRPGYSRTTSTGRSA